MVIVSGEKLYWWRRQAREAAIASNIPPTEVDWLLELVASVDKLSLSMASFRERDQIRLSLPLSVLTQQWRRRLQESLPVQYIAGVAPWRHFQLKVSPDVLIPRPETELLIDLVAKAVVPCEGNWVDMGTGSGAIALGLAELLTNASIYATDCSDAALAIARENAVNLGLSSRITFSQGSWWSPLANLKGKVSGMVSNPPYIPTQLISQLQPEVAQHEPHLALSGGADGLEHIRYLIQTAPEYLIPGGVWLIEMMAGQGEKVSAMLEEQGSYTKINIFPDLAGIDRFVLAYRSY
ncbi:MAG: peptide chain release factor N(5)-glutamine methyltransferase [Prochloron sp. SP5CPC1]|nr:peptide chain release factor N(5)-glutamine methyltransferase [Candidatus Paraprochloron terpiosi SP5CPC1]